MNELAVLLWPTALFAVCALAIAVIAMASLRWLVVGRQRRERAPGLLREPAHSLRRRLEIVSHHMTGGALGLTTTLFVWALLYPSALDATEDFWDTVVFASAGVAALGWFAQEIVRYLPERVGLRNAIDAQTRTALSLNILMRQKYWVFHDLHIGGHRIHHLVVGPRGVFCIASLGRRVVGRLGLTGRRPPPKAEVLFDGHALKFPGWEESDILEEAEAPANWLGPWLASELAEPPENIPTHAAIALPGWQVTSTDWKRLLIFNPTTPNMLIQGAPEGRQLDTTTTQALIKLLQQHHEAVVEAGLYNPVSATELARAAMTRVLGRQA
jgi:hypothetical protein